MKKFLLITIIIFSFLTFMGCNSKIQTTKTNSTEEIEINNAQETKITTEETKTNSTQEYFNLIALDYIYHNEEFVKALYIEYREITDDYTKYDVIIDSDKISKLINTYEVEQNKYTNIINEGLIYNKETQTVTNAILIGTYNINVEYVEVIITNESEIIKLKEMLKNNV